MINSMPKMLLLYFLLVYKLKKDKYIYIYIHRYSTDDINVTTFSRIYLNGRLSVALYFHLFFYSTGSHGSISWFYVIIYVLGTEFYYYYYFYYITIHFIIYLK